MATRRTDSSMSEFAAQLDAERHRDRIGRVCRPRRHQWTPNYLGLPGHHWTQERIIEKIREWTAQYGEPPFYDDWHPAGAKRRGHPERAERFYAGDWPSAARTVQVFGSFRAALLAAGLPRMQRQGPPVTAEDVRRRLEGSRHVAIGPNALATELRALGLARQSGDPEELAQALDAVAVTAATYAAQVRAAVADAQARGKAA